jgi:phage shock protein PspC (stress-responsive transcriptional regulator)
MQRISVTVRLNGRSVVQFDAAAYQRLEAYLAESESLLEGDPDPAEIMNDLEQAIADRCAQRLTPDRPVATLAELDAALDEIGTVQVADAAAASAAAAAASASPASTARPNSAGQPLRQHSQGAVVSGVCLGLARFVGLDAMWVRIVAVVLTLVTGGGAIVVYAALMLLLPFAPLEPGGPPVGWLPGKCRDAIEFLRSRLNGGTVTTS